MASFIVYGDASGQVTVQAPAVAGSNTITFPAETGTLITSASTTPLPGQIAWNTTVQTTGFTAVAYGGYFCNTTSAAFTVTLPATPTRGQFVVIVDYAGTSATNNITVSGNGANINGAASNKLLQTNRQGITFTYIDATQGWLATSNVYGGSTPFINAPYTASYLVVAGGGSTAHYQGGGGGAGGYLTGTLSLNVGTVYTAVVGGGGAAEANGSDSTFPGVATAVGGGRGATGGYGNIGIVTATSGGSGGGGGAAATPGAATSGGAGTPGQGNAGGIGYVSPGIIQSGGGGGAGAAGGAGTPGVNGAGGVGLANSITGTPAFYAGGGALAPASGGNGGGGSGGNGTANTGGGSGGGGGPNAGPAATAYSGGSGVVIISVPTANYSGTTTGSPTITTSGSNTIITFTATGTYTA